MNQTDFFKCLSDPTRLDILKLILCKQQVCVCEICSALTLSQPKISRHLALLRQHGLLLDQRQGQWVYYRLNPQLPDWATAILQVLNDHTESIENCCDRSLYLQCP